MIESNPIDSYNKGTQLKKTAIYEYYAFGYNYRLLRESLLSWDRATLIKELNSYFINLETLETPVSLKVAEALKTLLTKLEQSTEDKVSTDLSQQIIAEINKIDPALDAELQLKEAYVLTEKRFPLTSLTNDPQKLLGQDVFASLSTTSQKDFSLGCMQIALSQPTSSAFHLMRALEEEVKRLYHSFKKTNRLEKPMWGPMVKELREKKAPKPSSKSLDHLDSIRVHFRNPTQHPNAFYSLDESQDLLNQTITAINMIHREITSK